MTTARSRRRLRLRRIRITGWSTLSALLVTVVGFLTWFHIVLPAERGATLEVFRDDSVSVIAADGLIVFAPVEGASGQGMVFYPGAKVDPYAYLTPFHELVREGLTVVIVEPLFNMALFDTTPLATITAQAPEVGQWFAGGHSLGGVKACMVAEDPAISGLVLFASFCDNDLSTRDIALVQILGDRDDVTDPTAVETSQGLLPEDHISVVIPGASHASFGAYGPQSGDGVATISRADMVAEISRNLRTHLLAAG